MQARYTHAAGIITDEVTSEHFVAVTGGYYPDLDLDLDSTEILQDGEWVQGKICNTITPSFRIFQIQYLIQFLII